MEHTATWKRLPRVLHPLRRIMCNILLLVPGMCMCIKYEMIEPPRNFPLRRVLVSIRRVFFLFREM